MLPVLNEVDVRAAVIGNHDFGKSFSVYLVILLAAYFLFFTDFGVDNLCELIECTNAVWLLSNVTDKTTGEPLAGQKHTVIEWEGHKAMQC